MTISTRKTNNYKDPEQLNSLEFGVDRGISSEKMTIPQKYNLYPALAIMVLQRKPDQIPEIEQK
jgi:hypothetical protein